jgi:hypothetical protein
MSQVVVELLLRFIKPLAALGLGALLYLAAIGPLGEPGSVALWLLCWIAAGTLILLLQESPL